MRISAFVVMCVLMMVNLLIASPGHGQKYTDKKISIDFNNIPLKEVFLAIESKAGVEIMCEMTQKPLSEPVIIKMDNQPLAEILDSLLLNRKMKWNIRENIIRIEESSEIHVSGADVKPTPDFPSLKLNPPISGVVRDAEGKPIAGANIFIKGTKKGTVTDANGGFTIDANKEDRLIISFVEFETREIAVGENNNITVTLLRKANDMKEIEVFSTGYQSVPKERATGSFAKVNNELINRSVSTGILDRLDGVVSGVLFNRGARGDQDPITIRGRNTIFANANPLIVLDGFPFDGNIDNINPNDIASITVLKDAAAASIWGARAGNGVIVIITKTGRIGKPLNVSLVANLKTESRPDLFANPRMTSSEFIELEKWFFDQGFYDSRESSVSKRVIPEAVEIFFKQERSEITEAEAAAQLDALKKRDVRHDFEKYFYRPAFNQQYAVNASGGGPNYTYYISTGFDNNQLSLVKNNYRRYTINTLNTFSPVKNLEITAGINYINTLSANNNPGYEAIQPDYNYSISPYAQLADLSGNPVATPKNFRKDWIEDPSNNYLLDWHYRPLEELSLADNSTKQYDTRMQASVKYTFIKGLDAEVKFQYQKGLTEVREYKSAQTFEMRNLINQFTQKNPDGSLTYPVPVGGSLYQRNSNLSSRAFRAQLNYNRLFNDKHEISLLAGYETREQITNSTANKYYGYEDDLATYATVDFMTYFPQIPEGYSSIEFANGGGSGEDVSAITNRYISSFANGAYTYNQKYTLSLSARNDASNLFGVKTNQKSVPLWSAGMSWNIGKESFYHSSVLPVLKLRATYGYNGNTINNVTAYLTAYYLTSYVTGSRNAVITSPANPDLTWERVRMINLAADFGFANDRISGSVEFFNKHGYDIWGDPLFAPSAGIASARRNVANTKGKGFDITINSRNLAGEFSWNTSFLLSYSKDIVSKYQKEAAPFNYIQSASGTAGGGMYYPYTGYPVFSLFSYRYGGLDPATGDPTGYLNNEKVTDYNDVINKSTLSDMVYHGSAVPTFFGALRNDFSFKNFSLSFNIVYKLKYFFRRNTFRYNGINFWAAQHADYTKRWQQPGDELITNVPSRPALPLSNNRDDLYAYADVNVEKGDHIRLQDIRLGYDLKKSLNKLPVSDMKVFVYANQLGLLWKANKYGLDPDNQVIPPSLSVAIGFTANF